MPGEQKEEELKKKKLQEKKKKSNYSESFSLRMSKLFCLLLPFFIRDHIGFHATEASIILIYFYTDPGQRTV